MNTYEHFLKEKKLENICERCGSVMDKINRKHNKRYGKKNTYFICPICGHQFRERTVNEILRDIEDLY